MCGFLFLSISQYYARSASCAHERLRNWQGELICLIRLFLVPYHSHHCSLSSNFFHVFLYHLCLRGTHLHDKLDEDANLDPPGGGGGGVVAQSIEHPTPGEEAVSSISTLTNLSGLFLLVEYMSV